MKKVYLLILVFLFCKEQKKNLLITPNESNPLGIYLEFGTSPSNQTRQVSKANWGLSLKTSSESICFASHSEHFYTQEFGPKISVCFKNSEENLELANSILKEYETSSTIQTIAKLEGDGFQSKIYFWSQIQILKLLEENFKYVFLGEKKLCDKRREIFSNPQDFEFCTSGKWKNIETSFSLPYFSLLVDSSNVYIFFPESNFSSGRTRKYFGIHIENNEQIEKQIHNFFTEINEKQQSFIANCQISPIYWTEAMGISNSHTGKFLEIHSPSENPVCLSEFEIKVGEVTTKLEHKTKYLLPKSNLLFIPEDSRLEGEIYSEINWKEIRSGKNFILSQNGFQDEWNSAYLGSVLEDIEFSAGKLEQTCKHYGTISFSKNFCGSPGLPNFSESNCNFEQLVLSEINFIGLQKENVFHDQARFIELEFKGDKACKYDYAILKVGNRFYPLNMEKVNWNISPILLIAPAKYYEHSNQFDRELGEWKPSQEITIWDGKNPVHLLWKPRENITIFSKTKNTNYSVIFVDSEILLHTKILELEKNSMSPGKINPEPKNFSEDLLSNVHLSEINAKGSYTEKESIPSDKFLEIFTPLQISLKLELSYRKGKFIYYFPAEETYSVLAKEKFYCISSDKFFIDKDVLFPFEDIEWSLYYKNYLLDKKFFSKSEQGFENRTKKIRSSYVFTKKGKTWKYSNRSHLSLKPECQNYTLASPGEPNLFEPFFEEISYNTWNLFFPLADLNYTHEIFAYSHLPNHNVNYKIFPLTDTFLFEPQGMQVGNLYYLYFQNGSEYAIYQRKKALIQAVLPHPENPQNEWILFCNYTGESIFVQDIEVVDQTHSDFLIPFQERFPTKIPTSLEGFNFTSSELNSGSCAYILDPDANSPYLFLEGTPPTLVWTVKQDSSIGNGIGISEGVDIFHHKNGEKIHLHSFRNQFSNQPWVEPAQKKEIFYLKKGKLGTKKEDYEILLEETP